MRALKESVKDLEEMFRMKEESIKLLTSSLSSPTAPVLGNLVVKLANELAFVRDRYSKLLSRFTKLDLQQNFLKPVYTSIASSYQESRTQFSSKVATLMEEQQKLTGVIKTLEDKKKTTIREGKRRVVYANPDEAFIILTANNDSLSKEIHEKTAEISVLKKQNADLTEENVQIKAELYKIAALVKFQFFGSMRQAKARMRELREVESNPNVSFDFNEADESVNWGPLVMPDTSTHKDAFPKIPGMQINLDGFPGVEKRENEDLLKKVTSEPGFQTLQMTEGQPGTVGANVSPVDLDRINRNYKRVIYHNNLLLGALSKSHELVKEYRSTIDGLRTLLVPKNLSLGDLPSIKPTQANGHVRCRSVKFQLPGELPSPKRLHSETTQAFTAFRAPGSLAHRPRSQSTNQHIPQNSHQNGQMSLRLSSLEAAVRRQQFKQLDLPESKRYMRRVAVQLKSYFDKIVQRIVSPCSFVRIDERDVPDFKIRIERAVSWG